MTCININVIPQILLACPNLSSLHVTFLGENHPIPPPSSSYNHPLEKLILNDLYHNISFETIALLFLYIPNLTNLSLFLQSRRPFLDLIELILHRFEYLSQFECEIFESLNNPVVDLETIQQMNECFCFLQCEERENRFRCFFTE